MITLKWAGNIYTWTGEAGKEPPLETPISVKRADGTKLPDVTFAQMMTFTNGDFPYWEAQ